MNLHIMYNHNTGTLIRIRYTLYLYKYIKMYSTVMSIYKEENL